MPIYLYKARMADGKLVKGKIESSNEQFVLRSLEEGGAYPVEVREAKRTPFLLRLFGKRGRRLSADERILFTRQLQSMLGAGISLTGSLQALTEQSESEALKAILEEARQDIEGGATLTQALKKHPSLYSNLYVNMIHAGEEGGVLDEMLDRIGYLMEYEAEMRSRIKSATFYPCLVVGELFLAFLVIIKFVFPRFRAIFASHQAALPLPTQAMIAASDFADNYWYHILIGVGILFILFRWYKRTEKGRARFDSLFLKAPIFGDIVLKVLMSRFTRVLGALLDSGMPFVRALSLVEKTIQNVIVRNEVQAMREGIKKGQGLTQAIRKGGVFPPAVIRMLEVGERAGSLDEMLLKISSFYDSQLDYRIKNLTSVIEPILLVILGVSVLFIALAVFLPMWNLMQVLSGG